MLKTYQNIDGLILNAGTLEPMGKVGDPDIGLNAWKQHFDVNFFSLVSSLKLTLPALRKSELGGRVVFVSSGAAVGGISGWGAYNASKAAMNSLARSVNALERLFQHVLKRQTLIALWRMTNLTLFPSLSDREWLTLPFVLSNHLGYRAF